MTDLTAEHVARAARIAIRWQNKTWDSDVIEDKARVIACNLLESFAQMVVMSSEGLDQEEAELRW